jgi:hypothetical protein
MRALLSFIVSTTSFASSLWAGVAAAAEPFNWSLQVDDPIHAPAELVESMHIGFGYNHCRAVHAKGIILQGEFTPDTHAKEITKAPHLTANTAEETERSSSTQAMYRRESRLPICCPVFIRRHSDYQRRKNEMSPLLRETEGLTKSQAA